MRTAFAVLVGFYCFIAIQALAVVSPTASTVWSFSGGRNVIEWSFLPLTNPPPASNLFDIYLRQNAGGLYTPPLNISIATSINSQTHSSLSFPLTGQLKTGGNYQIFLSAPGNALLAYAESPAFSVGTAAVNTPAVGSVSQISIATTASVSTSTTSSPASPTGNAVNGIVAVQEQGGLVGQGGNTFVSSAGLMRMGGIIGVTAVVSLLLV